MNSSRREFLKTTALVCSAMSLPGWVLEAEAAAAAGIDRNKLADIAIARAKKLGATYADIRINRYRNESVFTREERVQNVSRTQSFGFGVRVLLSGAWGFAASPLSKRARPWRRLAVAACMAFDVRPILWPTMRWPAFRR